MPHWSRNWRWLAVAAASMLAVWAFSACSSDDDDKATSGATSPAAAGGALKIGLLAPYTGGLASFGPQFENAAKLAVKLINEGGGVNGKDVVIVTGDEGESAESAVAEANRLVNVEKVNAIVGAAGSTRVLAVAESVTGPKGILQITPSGTSPALTAAKDSDFLFRTPISDAAQGIVLAQLVNELGFKSVCAMYVNNAYGKGLSDNFAKAYEDKYSGKVTAAVGHAESGTTFVSELNQCVAGKPEALVAVSYPKGQAQVYLREALENNIIKTFVFVDGTKDGATFKELGWDNFDGMSGTAPSALETQNGKEFDALYQAEYGQGYSVPFIRETYDAVVLIALSAQSAGSTDGKAMRDKLRDIANAPGEAFGPGADGVKNALAAAKSGKDTDYQGAAGITEFDPNGDVLTGAIEVWHVDAAKGTAGGTDTSKGLITDKVYEVDLKAGTVKEVPSTTSTMHIDRNAGSVAIANIEPGIRFPFRL